ncbi:phosphate ABC transporter ATP-binding protein PstB [Shewanella sp. TC10]|uniref:phosphate ABC transporter ATP-binding protein PstB n=1 Tax=Shewanella sp. TC10 TaxID=1419739 RepID=UPI00129DC6D9|nr:phosphate ABC transporter ATP-binding protein PstB [Shewanella sp. TC10]
MLTSNETLNKTQDLSAADLRMDVKHLDFLYQKGAKPALNKVSLPVHNKRVTALIGPSGCGKSTLLRTMNRIFNLYRGQQVKGEILLDGESILSSSVDVSALRSKIGMVFQKPTPFPMSIYDNMAFGLKLNGDLNKVQLEERIEKALRRAHLWEEVKDKLNSDASGLSGGQQQRLCIARTIALEPEVILMDEPTSALDPISTAVIEELITELREKYTIVIVTHNMQQARRISDYTGFMYLGEMIEFGETSQVFNQSKHEKTQQYISGNFG